MVIMGSTEVATIPPRGVALMDDLGIKLADQSDLALVIAERLARATTADELFNEEGSNGWADKTGIPYTIRTVWYLPSSFGEGIGFFAVVEAVNMDTGEVEVLTTGAINVLIQLAKGMQQGWLDRPVILARNDTPTSNGYYPMRLRLA